jgi:hypothetical protein
MDIDVQSRDLRLTAGLDTAVRRAAERHAGPVSRRLHKVTVRVYDLEGSMAGLDKGCLVVADLLDGRVVVSSDVDRDLDRAIDRAFAKLGHAVANPADAGAGPAPAANGSALVGVGTQLRTGPRRRGATRPRGN